MTKLKFEFEKVIAQKLVWELIFLICILIIAGYFRVAYPQLAEFKGDECGISLAAIKLAKGQNFPCIGLMSSKNISMPPFFVYLMAIPYAFSKDPAIASAFVGFLNILAVCACYVLCRSFFGKGVAVVSTLLFAFSPWAVFLSRKIWPQDVLPLFNICFIYCIYLVLKNTKSKAILPAILILAVLPGFHLTAVAVFVTFGVAIVLVHPKINWKYFVLGIIFISVLYFPYLRHEFLYEKTNWINQIAGSNIISFSAFSGSLKIIAYESLNYCIGLPDSSSFLGESILTMLRFLFFVGFVSSFILMFKKYGIKQAFPFFYITFNAEYLSIVLWYIVPVLLFCTGSIENTPHYYLILSPVQFTMVALGFIEIWKIFYSGENNYTRVIILLFLACFAKHPFISILFIMGYITINSFYSLEKLKILTKAIPYLMLLALSSAIIYETIFIHNVFKKIKLYGGAPGDYWVSIKYQKDAVNFIIDDARKKYIEYGKPVFCENNLPYWNLLEPKENYKYITFKEKQNYNEKDEWCVFRYAIDVDFNRPAGFDKPAGFITYKYFGPIRVVVSRANAG